MEDLLRDTEYEVSVAAVNQNGTGVFSPWVAATTLARDLPGQLASLYQVQSSPEQ